MTKQPTPRLDALRAMREAEFERNESDEKTRATLRRQLETRVREAAASSDAAVARRKAKRVAKSLRRGNPA